MKAYKFKKKIAKNLLKSRKMKWTLEYKKNNKWE